MASSTVLSSPYSAAWQHGSAPISDEKLPAWARALRQYAGNPRPVSEPGEVLHHLRNLYNPKHEGKSHNLSACHQEEKKQDFSAIPSFYFKKNSATPLQGRIRKEARTRFLEHKAEALLEEEDLEQLWKLLLDHFTPPREDSERLNYDAFCTVARGMPEKAQCFFRPSTFMKFAPDDMGRICSRSFFLYLVRKVSLTQLRISLTCYDDVGSGYLREQDLENYIFEQIPSLPQLSHLEQDFYPYYVFTAVRKFVFFLDPLRKGKIAIKDIVSSPILKQFNELRQHTEEDVGVSPDSADWFSARQALKIYATYLSLDVDHNGMLCKDEFSEFNGDSLTDVYVDHLFQEYRMYKSETGRLEMDYKTFLDFVLAMHNKETPQALRYFWKILDINHCGYITLSTLNYFFKAVVQKMILLGHERVRVEDVTNEIFDMVSPVHPHRITLDDLIRSKVGHTVVGILTDVNGFWQYDNREMLIAHDEETF